VKIRIDPLDSVFSKYIRLKNDNKCEACGQPSTQVHHYFSRKRWNTRCDEDNVVPVCFGCHRDFHEDGDFASSYFKKRLGRERYEQLCVRGRVIKKRFKWEYEALKEEYKERIKTMEENNG
jgi:hypothetical protein